MKAFYLISSGLICLLFVYATWIGWDVAGSWSAGRWGPRGQSAHTFYHK